MKAEAGAKIKIARLKFDPRNANKGTKRGRAALATSLRKYGAGRSILLDRNGTVIAGNKTLEQAIARGDTEVQVVQTDGSQLIAVQRVDLDLEKDAKAKSLAVADNRVGELDLSWNPTELAAIGKEVDLSEFFNEDELADLMTDVPQLAEREQELKPKTFVRVLISVPLESAGGAKELIDRLALVQGIEIDYSAN